MAREKSYPIVSLFSGSGGLDIGFRKAGFRPILAMDVDKAAVETYKHNLPESERAHVIKEDLSSVEDGFIFQKLAQVGATERPIGVVGGPPCQAFSMSNVYKTPDDSRARLPFSYAKILRELNHDNSLHFFVFENVLGLTHKHHSALFDNFKKLFEAAGFKIFEGELDAQDFGVAQERKRVFIVGFNEKLYPGMTFTFPTSKKRRRTVKDEIGSLPEPTFFEPGLTPEDIPFHPNHWCMRPRSQKFYNGFLKEGDMKGRPFRVLSWDRPSWTVAYGHREVHIHPSGKRRLAIYEAMRLQGYPKQYVLCGTLSDQIRLVSDAVSPPVAEALAKAVIKQLKQRAPTGEEQPACLAAIASSGSSKKRST